MDRTLKCDHLLESCYFTVVLFVLLFVILENSSNFGLGSFRSERVINCFLLTLIYIVAENLAGIAGI